MCLNQSTYRIQETRKGLLVRIGKKDLKGEDVLVTVSITVICTMAKSSLGRKRIIPLTLPGNSPSPREVLEDKEARGKS